MPLEGSALIDGGIEISALTQEIVGSSPDIGAYEFGGELWEAGYNGWYPRYYPWTFMNFTSYTKTNTTGTNLIYENSTNISISFLLEDGPIEEDIIIEIDTFDNENMADYGRDWIIIYDEDSIFDPNKDIIWEKGKDSIVLNIHPINDDIYEGTETLGTGFIGVSALNRVAFINTGIYSNLYDDDPMPTASFVLSPDSITENSETTTVKLTLSNPSKFDISLGLTAEDSPFVFDLAENNKDYIFDVDTLTFPALSTEQEFSVTSIQDSEVEGNEIAVINIESTEDLSLIHISEPTRPY